MTHFSWFSRFRFKQVVPRKKLFWQICCQILSQKLVILCTFLYLVPESQKYQRFVNWDFLFLERVRQEIRNHRLQKMMICGFPAPDTKKVHKITNFCDKIRQQICQKSFFLSITCQLLYQKNYQKRVILLNKVLELGLKSKSVFSKSCSK